MVSPVPWWHLSGVGMVARGGCQSPRSPSEAAFGGAVVGGKGLGAGGKMSPEPLTGWERKGGDGRHLSGAHPNPKDAHERWGN